MVKTIQRGMSKNTKRPFHNSVRHPNPWLLVPCKYIWEQEGMDTNPQIMCCRTVKAVLRSPTAIHIPVQEQLYFYVKYLHNMMHDTFTPLNTMYVKNSWLPLTNIPA